MIFIRKIIFLLISISISLNIFANDDFDDIMSIFDKVYNLSSNINKLKYNINTGTSIYGFYLQEAQKKQIIYKFEKNSEYLIIAAHNNDSVNLTVTIKDILKTYKNISAVTPLVFFKTTDREDSCSIIISKDDYTEKDQTIVFVFKKNTDSLEIPFSDVMTAATNLVKYKDKSLDEIIPDANSMFFLVGGSIYSDTQNSMTIVSDTDTETSDIKFILTKNDTISNMELFIKRHATIIGAKASDNTISLHHTLDKNTKYSISYTNNSPLSYERGVILLWLTQE